MIANSKKSASILGLFSMLIRNIFSFFLTPLMIIVFGKGDFGVYKIVLSTTAYFMLLDMGMHNVIIRYISKFNYANDTRSQNKYLGLVQLFYIIVSVLVLITSIVLYQFIPSIFINSLTTNEISLFLKVFIILTANSMVMLMFNVYAGIIKAHERFIFLKSTEMIKIIIRATIIYILLLNKFSVVAIVITDLVINVISGSINFIYTIYILKLKPEVKYIRKNDIREVFSYSSFIFLNMLALQLFWASDSIILGILTNAALVAIYSVGVMVNGYFQSFAGVFSEFLMPSAVRMVEENRSKEELSLEMARIGRYIFICLGLIIVGFSFLGDKFIILWLGRDFKLAYMIALIVMIPQIFTYAQNFGANVMWAKNKHQLRAIVMLIVALLNILITIILVGKIGIMGAAIGTCFAYVVGYLIFTTWYYDKYVGLDMVLFTKELLRKIIIAYLPILLTSYIIRISLPGESWSVFLIQGLLMTIVYCVFIYLIGMNDDEKFIVRNVLYKVLGKKV